MLTFPIRPSIFYGGKTQQKSGDYSMSNARNLLGISPRLDNIIKEFARLALEHANHHPANAGDVSQVLDNGVATILINRFGDTASQWFEIAHLDRLATIRADGRKGY